MQVPGSARSLKEGGQGIGTPGSNANSVTHPSDVPSYMREMKKPDTGTTAGEVASFWNVGLRASGYNKDTTPPSSAVAARRPGVRSWK
mmetsp:Transcript_12434/g.27949  ORF Transcript_12434/g.27949 Transcript_12434/m.27949 type:complete len:88 (-) Transcript_12434:199-462(-)